MKRWINGALALAATVTLAAPAHAAIMSVSGPLSSAGTSAAIIGAPSDVLDDLVFNTGMQGFDEAQNVVTSSAYGVDGGTIAAGTRVDSHMIFLNSQGTGRLSHFDVVWTFSGKILGVMSDSSGNLEAASSGELGNPATNYTVTFPGSGPAAPFTARGLEGNTSASGPFPNDGYALVDPFSLRVGMSVTEPGDWIRVVTATPVPTPATFTLMAIVLAGLGLGMTFNKRGRRTA